jgi:hypothetical protein
VKYALLVCTDQATEEPADVHPRVMSWVQQLTERGVLVQDQRLSWASDATTVRVRDDEVLLTDGPFAETQEQIAGFVVIECADLDEAIEVAASNPLAGIGAIEVRPFWAG